MFTISHNLKNNKDGFAILAALVIVVIFSIAISQWITTDSVSSKFKISPLMYAKNLAQAQQINNLITSSKDISNSSPLQANKGACPPESSACSRYIYATQQLDTLCTFSHQNSSINNKKILTMVWLNEGSQPTSPIQTQLTTCVSDLDGENIALSIWRLTLKDGNLYLMQEDEF
jgi:hypothetical protein